MRKVYVLDTSAIITDPDIFNALEDNEIVVPLAVLKELDHLKSESNTERGQKARKAIRLLDEFRRAGDITEGVATPSGGIIRFVVETPESVWTLSEMGLDTKKTDVQVVALGKELDAIIISNDIALCTIAGAVGVQAEGYRAKNIEFNDKRYSALDLYLTDAEISNLVANGSIQVPLSSFDEFEPLINQGLIIKPFYGKSTVLGRYAGNGFIRYIDTKLLVNKTRAYIEPRNAEQWFALELLMDPSIQLVNMVGIAGAGKTLLTLAAGCIQVFEGKGVYNKLAITKSVVAFGKQDIGFIPGDVNEKMAPVIGNLTDHLDNLLAGEADMFKMKGQLVIEPLAYIRGKSLDDMFLVVDEAQNLSEDDLLTILTRAGNNTKIVLTGDPTQCDSPYLNAFNNGLMRVVKAFENQSIAGTAILKESQRQTLAKLAAQLLGNNQKFWSE